MTKLARSVVVGLIALAGMAFTGVAFAYAPSFSVTTTVLGNTTLSYTAGVGDPPTQRLTFFVPQDYAFNFAADAGAGLATASATATAADQGNATLALTGSIYNALPTDVVTLGTAKGTLASLAAACTGVTTAQSAYMVMSLTAAGQQLQIPVYAQVIHAGALYSDTSIVKLTVCLPPPDVPVGIPGRAVLGTNITSMTIVFQQIFSALPGIEIWHLQATPFSAGTGKANPGAAVEAESSDQTPQSMTLSAVRNAKTKKVVASGKVNAGGKGVSGVAVKILAGSKVIGKTTTKAGGKYSVSLTTKATKLSGAATAAVHTLAACTSPILAPLPCVSATTGPFTTAARAVAVKG